MLVRELITRLGFDLKDAPLKKAEGMISAFKGSAIALAGVVAGIGTGLYATAKSAANFGDNLYKTSQRIGIGVESLQKLQYAAGLADLENEEFTQGVTLFSKKIAEAAKGGKEAAGAFTKLGVKIKDSKGKILPTDQILLSVSDKFAQMQDGAQKTGLALDFFGRSGGRMIPFLNAGRDEIGKMGKEIEDLGLVMGIDAAKAGEAFNDNLRRLHVLLSGIKNLVGAKLIPVLLRATEAMIGWVKANKDIIRLRLEQFFKIFIAGAEFAWKNVKILTAAVIALGIAFGWINPVTAAMVALGAAVALLYDDFKAFEEGRGHLLDWPAIIQKVTDAVTFLKDAFAGLKIVIGGIRDTVNEILAPFEKLMEMAGRFGMAHLKAFGLEGAYQSLATAIPAAGGSEVAAALNPNNLFTAPFKGLANIGREARGAGVQNNNVKNDLKIEINLPAGADAQGVADAVKKGIEDHLGNVTRSALRSIEAKGVN